MKNCGNVTMCVVKPPLRDDESIERRYKCVRAIIENAGLKVSAVLSSNFPKSMIEELYRDHRHWHYFPWLVNHMVTGEAVIMLVTGENASRHMRALAGPTYPEVARETSPNSIRARLSDPSETKTRSQEEERVVDNIVHTPNPEEDGAVEREVGIFFPWAFVHYS